MMSLQNEPQINPVGAPEDRAIFSPKADANFGSFGAYPQDNALDREVLETVPCDDVIIADDDALIRKVLERWLTRAGYKVREATTGLEALRMVQADPPDFLITDWEMPEMEGPQLCRELRSLSLPHYLYILMLTSHNDVNSIVEGLDSGADDYLSKPIREAELVARLRAGSRILQGQRNLQRLARTDSLTGLLSRRSFHDLLRYEFERARRTGKPLSCAILDLDFFKRINDTYGHHVGDVVLKATGELLQKSCRKSGITARYGGEEFCVLLPETPEEGAAAWAENFRIQLATLRIATEKATLSVTCSVGVSGLYDDTLTPEQLIDQADQALLCAKRTGRDRVVTYGSLNQQVDLDLSESHRRQDLFEGIRAEHVMTPIVAPLYGDETVEQVAAYFLRSRISSAPVVNEQGQLVGIISEKDLMESITCRENWNRPISQLMRPHVITYPIDAPVRTIYEFLCRVAMRRVIITDQGVPVGAVSRASLLRWFRNLVLAEQMRGQENLWADETPETVIQTALTRIAQETEKIERTLTERPPDLAAYLVGAASRIQELAVDILAFASAIEAKGSDHVGCGASSLAE